MCGWRERRRACPPPSLSSSPFPFPSRLAVLCSITMESGVSMAEARKNIWLVDSKGLIVADRTDLQPHKVPYAHPGAQLVR